jgi:5-methyltetrahydropteroyltriglutamate--homocysteine methyltransferase
MLTHTLGFPRFGANRELKYALEGFWSGRQSQDQLLQTAQELRSRHWHLQRDNGVDLIPAGDFSLYDHVLDTLAMLGAVPERYGWQGDTVDLETYFKMARGAHGIPAMEMSKWFNTNYHYIVPEFYPGQSFKLASTALLDQVQEALNADFRIKPVLLGPLTLLKLGKSTVQGFDPMEHLDAILGVYEEVVAALSNRVEWIQFDEPALVYDLTEKEAHLFGLAYERLARATGQSRLLLATYFESLESNADLAFIPSIDAVHIDLISGPRQLDTILSRLGEDQTLSLGVVDGRNVWRVNAEVAGSQIEQAVTALGPERVLVGTSCSLLHTPVDIELETCLDAELKSWMAFAKQKCAELRMVADWVQDHSESSALMENRTAWRTRRVSPRVIDARVRQRIKAITPSMSQRATPYADRKKLQQARLQLPVLPTTTIGSFPQTTEIRRARRQYKNGQLAEAQYIEAMKANIAEVIQKQESLGIDVLVHGEAERNDMVEYFGEQLQGFCATEHGWVQSYGSRCVKPPIIYGDVSRPEPMTLFWSTYAQSLTERPVKGMLTGPVTILCWSFVRDDQPLSDTCRQIALAIRDEVSDLESAGIQVIQIDEPALREGLPLRRQDWDEYLTWAVESFCLTSSGVKDETQIHTHMCYCEFNDILAWIARLDADVISIEASRSRMELLEGFVNFEYPNDIGPGIWDIHSPRVPGQVEMIELLKCAMKVIPAERLWVNPDCGLKTRAWPETLLSLEHLVAATHNLRKEMT